MLGLPPSVSVTKEETNSAPPPSDQGGVRTPPIITHTAATPMPTPQGSPNGASMIDLHSKHNYIFTDLHIITQLEGKWNDKS